MNRHKAHRIFVIASIYLLGIIVIMGLFLIPVIKERFAKTSLLEEQYPMLIGNYTLYPYEGRTIWIDEPGKIIPVIAAEKYETFYVYPGNIQEGNDPSVEKGVYVSKKHYVVYEQSEALTKPSLYGPFER